MTISLTTFERDFRERLLDVIHGQWHDLGVPFSEVLHLESTEVIDPEALIWCSLEFLPTEARLREGVGAWLRAHGNYVIRQRLNRLARKEEPRTSIWHVLDKPDRAQPDVPAEPCHGLDSPEDVVRFCEELAFDWRGPVPAHPRPGRPVTAPTTVLLQARDLLGGDLRHALLVYLLANPGGGRLKAVQRWFGYSYRSISETASRWETAGVLTIDHGYCRLTTPEQWHALLRYQADRVVIVDWLGVFEACVRLLRACAKAGRKGIAWDSPVIRSFCRDADEALASAILSNPARGHPSVSHLRDLLPQGRLHA
jgi:hypothetical protein